MGATILLVTVRGWTNSGDLFMGKIRGGELRADFIDTLQADLGDRFEVWSPTLDVPMFCMRRAESLAQEVYEQIDAKVGSMPELQHIILLGYSSGSLIARRVFCLAHGTRPDGEVDQERHAAWADKIERVVMLSGITRGWEHSTASPDHVRFLAPLLEGIITLAGWAKRLAGVAEAREPYILQLRRGSPFVVTTRIQYVKALAHLAARKPPHASTLRADGLPSTVFLLGARDEFVSPADCTELGARSEFVFIQLPGTKHTDAVEISGEDELSHARRNRLVDAIALPFAELRDGRLAVRAADIDDYLDPMDLTANEDARSANPIKHAVIVMHGIRDDGFWTKRVAREIKIQARDRQIAVRTPTPSYGFFSMWDFVRPGGRAQATRWFMERYADVRSHAPDADISFVGHSNGTYVAARALELCEAVRFKHMVFAGSVVRRAYRWQDRAGQVRSVLNYVGSNDRVVACLPGAIERLRLRWLDVGGAGAFGFAEADPPPANKKPLHGPTGSILELSECRFVPGGHDAAILEPFWAEIAAFALTGTPPTRVSVSRDPSAYGWAPVVPPLGAAVIAFLLLLPFIVAAAFQHASPAGLLVGLAAALFISWVVGRVLRKY